MHCIVVMVFARAVFLSGRMSIGKEIAISHVSSYRLNAKYSLVKICDSFSVIENSFKRHACTFKGTYRDLNAQHFFLFRVNGRIGVNVHYSKNGEF